MRRTVHVSEIARALVGETGDSSLIGPNLFLVEFWQERFEGGLEVFETCLSFLLSPVHLEQLHDNGVVGTKALSTFDGSHNPPTQPFDPVLVSGLLFGHGQIEKLLESVVENV